MPAEAERLYGKMIEVDFVEWIRGEEKFEGVDDLIRRMTIDAEEARAALAARAETGRPGAAGR